MSRCADCPKQNVKTLLVELVAFFLIMLVLGGCSKSKPEKIDYPALVERSVSAGAHIGKNCAKMYKNKTADVDRCIEDTLISAGFRFIK
jgi:hypothetical protein